jgi:hypothetical protein
MASNDNDKCQAEEEEEEEEVEEEVSLEETSMNQVDTSEEKLHTRRAHGYLFGDDGDTPRSRPTHHPHRKVIGATTRRAAMMMTMMMTTSECR